MATSLSTIKTYIAPDVLSCPDPVIERELISTIIEFCGETNILTKEFNYDIVSGDIDSTSYQYSIDVDLREFFSNYRPLMIIRVNIDGIDFIPEYREVIGTVENWDTIKETNVKYFFYPDSETIRFYDMETSDSDLYVKLSVKPERSISTVDDLLYEDWLDTIVAGTKFRLMKMPKKKWTNKTTAKEYYSEWRKGLSQAKLYGTKKYSAVPVEVHPRSFSYITWD